MRQHGLTWTGLVLIAVIGGIALLAPWASPHTVYEQSLERRLAGPSLKHPLGLDELGRDILSRMMYGARTSLWVGAAVVSVSLLAGTLIGCLAGYAGGWIDEIIMRIVDILLSFPGILLAIAMVAVLGPGLDHLVFALCVIGWVPFARLARAQTLKVREMDFVAGARASGAPPGRIVLRHIVPNLLGPLLVQATFGIAAVILAEAGLSFLGLGIQPPNPSWGSMLRSGTEHILEASHLTVYPGTAIAVTVLAFNFLGDGLREILDPRSPGEAFRAEVR
jgi:peptide/nickel transport system permease protein